MNELQSHERNALAVRIALEEFKNKPHMTREDKRALTSLRQRFSKFQLATRVRANDLFNQGVRL